MSVVAHKWQRCLKSAASEELMEPPPADECGKTRTRRPNLAVGLFASAKGSAAKASERVECWHFTCLFTFPPSSVHHQSDTSDSIYWVFSSAPPQVHCQLIERQLLLNAPNPSSIQELVQKGCAATLLTAIVSHQWERWWRKVPRSNQHFPGSRDAVWPFMAKKGEGVLISNWYSPQGEGHF